MTFTRAFLVAQMVKNLPAMQETWVRSLGQESPGEGNLKILPLETQETTAAKHTPHTPHSLLSDAFIP